MSEPTIDEMLAWLNATVSTVVKRVPPTHEQRTIAMGAAIRAILEYQRVLESHPERFTLPIIRAFVERMEQRAQKYLASVVGASESQRGIIMARAVQEEVAAMQDQLKAMEEREQMNEPKLLPCPFCGTEPYVYDKDTDRISASIVCRKCKDVAIIRSSIEQCAKDWNTRTSSELEAIRAFVERVEKRTITGQWWGNAVKEELAAMEKEAE